MKLEELLAQYMPSDTDIQNISEFFSMFSQETRIKIIVLLSVSDLNVNDLSRCIALNQSTISHQLRILKDRKIVESKRKGKEIFYTISNPFVNEVLFSALKATEKHFERENNFDNNFPNCEDFLHNGFQSNSTVFP